jgi:UDP-N-acetylglucosamine 2-epimerase
VYKVMTIVGTRPELIKMSRVIAEFDRHTNHILVHTGQNFDYELNEIFFEDMGIRKPDHFLKAVGENAAQTIGRVIELSDALIEAEKPDAVLLYGDTNSCLSVISAKRRQVPVFHMEAGNRCFDQRVPEELNRKVIDHLSDINMVLTEHARRYLLAEGIRPETIFKTGSHMVEVLNHYRPKILASDVLPRLGLTAENYVLVSAHRQENVDTTENLRDLIETLNAIVEHFDLPIVVSTHPRTKARLDMLTGIEPSHRIRFLKPFGYSDYNNLQMNAFCVVSDSGTLTEESDLLNFPAVMIRNAHERPEGMDAGTLIMAGMKTDRVLDAIRIITVQRKSTASERRRVADYANPSVSSQVLRIVQSYIEYVRRTVWSAE